MYIDTDVNCTPLHLRDPVPQHSKYMRTTHEIITILKTQTLTEDTPVTWKYQITIK